NVAQIIAGSVDPERSVCSRDPATQIGNEQILGRRGAEAPDGVDAVASQPRQRFAVGRGQRQIFCPGQNMREVQAVRPKVLTLVPGAVVRRDEEEFSAGAIGSRCRLSPAERIADVVRQIMESPESTLPPAQVHLKPLVLGETALEE